MWFIWIMWVIVALAILDQRDLPLTSTISHIFSFLNMNPALVTLQGGVRVLFKKSYYHRFIAINFAKPS